MKMRMTSIALAMIVVLAGGTITGCNPGTSTSSSFDWPSDGPPGGGGNLVVAGTTELASLEPGEAGSAAHAIPVMRNVFQPLLNRNTKTSAIEPLLATKWTPTDDTNWHFTLRQGVTWHDGTPLNAKTAAASLTYIWNPKLTYSSNYVSGKARFYAIDDYTMGVELGQADPLFAARMTMLPLASPTQIAQSPGTLPTHPVGTGPYEFVSWAPGQNVKLKLYDKSWQAAPGMFDTVEWTFLQESQVRAQKVQTGEADIALGTTNDQCKASAQNGARCVGVISNGIRYLRIDEYHQTTLADLRIRQAIAYAIDRKAIAAAFITPETGVANNPGSQGMVGFTSDVDFPYDPQKAAELVKEAAADGADIKIPLSVKYRVDMFPNVADIAQTIVTNLKAAGLNAKVAAETEAVGLDQYRQTNQGKTIEDIPEDRGWLFLARTSSELFDFSQPASSILECDGKFSVYCEPGFTASLEAAKKLLGDERKSAMENLWKKYYAEQVPILPLTQQTDQYVISGRVQITPRADMFLPLAEARSSRQK